MTVSGEKPEQKEEETGTNEREGKKMLYAIMKDGKYVKEFSEGREFTKGRNHAEYFTNKKSASVCASEYGRKNGKGYKVVETFAPSWMK